MSPKPDRPTGLTAFIVIWIGQVLSLLGTAVSHFGLQLWVFDAGHGKATPMTTMGFFFVLPTILFTPIVGILVDRVSRKLTMMLSDLAAALCTFVVLLLYLSGALQIWHLYIVAFVLGTFQGFQWPAYSAAISTMLDKRHYARANAMLDLAGASSAIFAPLIAGALLGPLNTWMARVLPVVAARTPGEPGIVVLLTLDLISAAFAIGTLLFVHIPDPERSAEHTSAQGGFWHQGLFGFRYILSRPSLLGLQLVFLVGNFVISLGTSVRGAMILARTNSDRVIFGSIQTAGAVGGLVGGIAIGIWGGFRRRIHGVLLGWALSGVALAAFGASRSLIPWIIASFATALFTPLINASNQAIWQAKVPPDIQGRVFAARRLIAWAVSPFSQVIAGPIADQILEPAFRHATPGASWLTKILGAGPGAGMALQIVIAGILTALIGISGYLFPAIHDAESRLRDYDADDALPPNHLSSPEAA